MIVKMVFYILWPLYLMLIVVCFTIGLFRPRPVHNAC